MRLEKNYEFTVSAENRRVDVFLASQIASLSRSALTGENCEIFINGNIAKKSDSVKIGDIVSLFYVADVFEKIEPQDIPLDVLYEDNSLLVINKQQGIVVHPGAGNVDGTLVNALAYRYGQKFIDEMADECDISRPGIVHRLDKDTSGVMVIALTSQAHTNIALQFQNREIKKYYYALCDGFFSKKNDEIECGLVRDKNNRKLFTTTQNGGKYSKSTYSVQVQTDKFALVKVRIFTGRTHQIRVHMKSIGHPIIGDSLYNNHSTKFADKSLMLHSSSIEILHPQTGEPMKFTAPLPNRFNIDNCLDNIGLNL